MKFSLQAFRCSVIMAICVSLSACGDDAYMKRIRSARVVHKGKDPELMYNDRTSNAVLITSVFLGGVIVGGLVGGGIAAANNSSGKKRWSSVTRQQQEKVKHALTAAMQNELQQKRGWAAPVKGVADADFEFERVRYGMHHAGKQRFKVQIFSAAVLRRADGEDIWDEDAMGEGTSSWTLAEYQQNPRLFDEGLAQAARQLAGNFAQALQ